MTSKVIKGHKSSSNFTVNPTLPLLDGPLILPSPNCVYLFLSLSISFSLPLSFSYSLSISLSTSLFCSMQTLIYILKGHTRPFLCRVSFNNFQIFWSNYNLDLQILSLFNLNLRSYGQLFVLVYIQNSRYCASVFFPIVRIFTF